jgi:hypothetical protein
MDDQSKSPWNSLEIAKLAVGLLTPIVVVAFGYQVTSSFRNADVQAQKADKAVEDSRQLAQTRQTAVGNLSRFIYERRVRSELLLSALKRHANSPTEDSRRELIDRKHLYDESYASWNANHQANLLLVRQILGSTRYSTFEGLVESRLVSQTFAPIDNCLTQAYDLAIRNKDPRPLLKTCKTTELVQRALDCGYAITDELFKVSAPDGKYQEAASIVDSRCPDRPGERGLSRISAALP